MPLHIDKCTHITTKTIKKYDAYSEWNEIKRQMNKDLLWGNGKQEE